MPVRQAPTEKKLTIHPKPSSDSNSYFDEPLHRAQPLPRAQFSSDSDSSDSDSDSDFDLDQPLLEAQPLARTQPLPQAQFFSNYDTSSDSDSDSDSDLDQSLSQAPPLPRPRFSSDNDTSDSDEPQYTVMPSIPLKRPQDTKTEPSKKIKIWELPKKRPPHKWSEEDQITLLNGLIDFKSQHGKGPYNACVNMWCFHHYIQKKLKADQLNKWQVTDKVRRLKKKFFANLEKKGDHQEPVFSNPRDYLVFNLSKKLWFNDYLVNEFSKKTYGQTSGVKKMEEDELDFKSKYPLLAATFDLGYLSAMHRNVVDMMTRNMSLIGNEKMRDLEEKLKKLQDEEDDLRLKREDLIRENYEWLRQLEVN